MTTACGRVSRFTCVASGDGGLQTGYHTFAFTLGFEVFEDHPVEEAAERAARRAMTKLSARPAPSGVLPVVIKSGTGGILFHEACGHGLEADHIVKDSSVYTGPSRPSSSPARCVTLVDDGTFGSQWGSLGDRRRGPAHAAQRAHRERRAHRLHVGLPPRPQGGSRPRRATAVGRATSTCRWCG